MTADPGVDARRHILATAAALIRAGGPEAATTRAVAAAASIQPPTIYRLIGDKDALLDAVAEHELAAYVAAKQEVAPDPDPVEALKHGWDPHVAFGLAHPGLFRIMSSKANSPAAITGLDALRNRVHAIALAGRLRGTEERAAAMVHAACVGVVLTLLANRDRREEDTQAEDMQSHGNLSADTRDAVLAAITIRSAEVIDEGLQGAATTLRARLTASTSLTAGERGLLNELLVRISQER